MTSPELDHLMNQELDGTNSIEDSNRLHEALKVDPAARRQFRELQQMATVLDGINCLEPPPELARTILSALKDSRHESHPARKPSLDGVAFWRRPAFFRFAYVFVAGVGLGILGSALMRGDVEGPRLTGLSGTFAPRASRTSPEQVKEIPFQFDRGSGAAHVRETAEGSSITVETSTPAGETAELGLDLAGGQILGYRVEAGEVHRVSSTEGAIRWSQSGPGRITWYIGTSPSESVDVNLTVAVNSIEKFHTNFQAPPL